MLALDWAHLAAASIWIGGLAGLLVLAATTEAGRRVAVLAVVVPRFSRAAMGSVAVLLATGIVASIVHLPTLGSLWQTNYGLALIAKSVLLACALVLGAVNNLRSRPRLAAAVQRRDQALGDGRGPAAAAGSCSARARCSPAPCSRPRSSRASRRPRTRSRAPARPTARSAPGAVARTFTRDGVRIQVGIQPNRAAIDNAFALRLQRGGQPVRNARITAELDMLDMSMQQQAYTLAEVSPGVYQRSRPALVMVGHWLLAYTIEIPGRKPIHLQVVDKADG